MNHTDIAVIGAGIIGTSLAAELVHRGRTVTLIEADEAGGGTSAASYSWINSHKKHPLDYHALNLRGVAAWRRIAETLPEVVSFTGHVEIAESDAHRLSLIERTQRLIGLGYEARWSTPGEARARTPLPVPDDALVAIFDGEGHAFPQRWITHLTTELEASGTPVRRATAIRVDAHDDGARVVLADGDHVDAGAVVICTGARSSDLVASAGAALPLVPPVVDSPAFGYLADVVAPGHGLSGLVTTDRLAMRPGENGTLLVQALDLDCSAQPQVPAPAATAAQIEQRVAAVLPHTRPRIAGIRVGHRVIPSDGRTAAGRIAPGSSVWTIVTHSGVVLAPWLADVIANELHSGYSEPLLAPFRPDRFLKATAHAQLAAPRAPGDQ